MSSFPELRPDELLHGTGQCERVVGVLYGAAKIRRIPSGEPDVSVLAGRGHRSPRGDVTFKSALQFSGSPKCLGNCDWIGSGRMVIDGLKEVQEAVMLIEAGLSTYEKECAKRGDDYQEIFAQQVRETMERRAAGLKPPAWAAAAFESGLRQSTEEEKSDSRAA